MRLHNYKPLLSTITIKMQVPPFANEFLNWHINPQKNWKKGDID